ncbi:hypothetical protein VIBNISOn1_190034 [Vibrio nigripulchritudo SOn1]|uniref:Uncharacterized protein n=1 Tax=Vibrio nigripulchritudo SOn1 TaxID=1238450 RepID=A0AAV2VQ07_9VIBR|nr:hypothetical protein [Vibrio nigripulchritudo]CCO46815.1 hypothetical protein VIBNISOn1_190034 [Vibrio nigripulchritudo SOn1]
MTTFFRIKGDSFEYLVTDLQWKNLRDVESNSKYATQVEPHFKRYTHMGVRETLGKTMTLGVVGREKDLPVEPQKGLSLAFAFRHHASIVAETIPLPQSDKYENLVVYVAKLQDDSWSVTGITHGRIAIDSAFKTKETDTDSKATESKTSLVQENALHIVRKIADQYLKQSDAYNIRLVSVGLLQSEHNELLPLLEKGLEEFGNRCQFESTKCFPQNIQTFIDELGAQKTWYIGNIKRFNPKENKTVTKYLAALTFLAAVLFGANIAFTEKPAQNQSASSAWDTPKLATKSEVPKPSVVSQAVSTTDMDRKNVLRLKQQERDWYTDYLRKWGFNTALIMKKTIGSVPSEIEGYALANVSYQRLHKVGKPSLGEVALLSYVRKDDKALVTVFIDSLTQTNKSIRIRDKDIALDGQSVVAVMSLPKPKLENPYKDSNEPLSLPSVISTLQDYKAYNHITNWGISVSPQKARPHPINSNELRSVQRFYESEDYKEDTMLTSITSYVVTINSRHLKSLETINQILQAHQNALIEAFTFDVTTSELTTEIALYDIN